ncbi:J domain-containing protein [Hymenobacter guriensis]|uniref:DnaJ domain-containing protein n=1 Tax=Hymenobacter guriensis TaxID=2793065 RepID=A0ABS0L301_9BACT|nr:J domain-containing protein [Hymenobacter guriensis]MBG8554491.1 DnaJ domain-containing protein [Hymenobacter guriensis]
MSQNHYHVLGVSPTATRLEIKQAYKQLALRYHPDRHQGDTRYEELFKQISIAHGILADPARRAAYDQQLWREAQQIEQARRQQQFRHQHQHIYGAPPPAAGPVRTRRPASSAERHYRPIPRQKTRFTRRDYLLTFLFVALLIAFMLSVKLTMDHVTARSNYEDGLKAYTEQQWSTAHSYLSAAIHFKPNYPEAHHRRGEIEQLAYHDYQAALEDYTVAIQQEEMATPRRARLWWRMGQCYAAVGQSGKALRSFNQALAADSTQTGAWLDRGELRLFEQRQFQPAILDLTTGLRQRAAQGKSPSGRFLTYRGLAWFKLGEFQAARADYQQVLLNQPRNGQIYFLLGRLAEAQQNRAAACEFFGRAARLGYLYAEEARLKTPCL